jgi:5-(carboxyamino)imidazole ribonucleotide synthase
MFQKIKTGIIGGGQLGAMLVRSAIDFGLDVSVLDGDANAPCARYTSSFFVGEPMDYDAVMAFGGGMHIITIEKEAVNTRALRALRKQGVLIFPDPETIEIIQNKYIQKQFLQNCGVPVVPCVPVHGRADLLLHADRLPGCLKKCTSGYDGKGVMIVKDIADIDTAFEEPSILEEVVDIKSELSVIVARGGDGDIKCFDPVQMVFNKEKMLLDYLIAPAPVAADIATEALSIALKVAEALTLNGILAVEMFLTHDGRLLVNELAPRPHNSGHHTIEASHCSQYDALLRIMLGLPIGDTSLKLPAVMTNILEPPAGSRESIVTALKTILCIEGTHVHWYGKKEGSPGRKMGHITITGDKIEDALSKANIVNHMLKKLYEKS